MESKQKSLNGKDLKRIIPGAIISLGLLVLVFHSVNIDELKKSLVSANYYYVPIAIGAFLLSMVARTLAWRILLQKKATIYRVYITLNEGYLLNNIFPFRLGEIGRAFILSRTASLSFWQVLSTILIERIFDILMVVGILLITIPFVAEVPGAGPKALLIGIIVLLGLTLLYVLARNQDKATYFLERAKSRFSIIRLVKSIYIERFFNGLNALTDIRQFVMALFWMTVSWVLVISQYYLILLAFLPKAKFAWAGFGIGMVGLGVAVPSAPGGVGVVEATLMFVFGLFGINRSTALAYSILVHSIYFVVTSLIGLYGLFMDGESVSKIVFQLRSLTNSSKPAS